MRTRSLGLALILLLACGDSSDPAAPGTTDGSESGTTMTMSTSTSSGTTSDPDSSSSGPSSSSSSGESSSGTTMIPEQECGLEDLKPGTADPIEAGTRAMQIPPDIATILLDSCGCHLADDLTVPDVPDYPATGGFDMTTWMGWHGTHPATGSAYHDIAFTYVEQDVMPLQPFCNVPMDADQRATLLEWLDQEAPDAATWAPQK